MEYTDVSKACFFKENGKNSFRDGKSGFYQVKFLKAMEDSVSLFLMTRKSKRKISQYPRKKKKKKW